MTSVERQAHFLANWSKGKPITRLCRGSAFWKCGKWMTKITDDEVNELVAAGLATRCGDTLSVVMEGPKI